MTIMQRIILVITAVFIFLTAFVDINYTSLTPNQFRYYLIVIGATLLIAGLLYLAFNKKRGKKND